MDAFGLGMDRLMGELDQRLNANKADKADHAIRMRATDLLADIHGLKKNTLDVNATGGFKVEIEFVGPDSESD